MMRRLKIDFLKALEVMRKQTYGWKTLLLLSEQKSRSMIYSEYVENHFIQTDAIFANQINAKKEFKIGTFL